MIANFRFPVARVRALEVRKLPLFGVVRTRRRFSKQYYAARQKSLLDAGVIWSGRWASIVLALPEADGAFVDCEHCREVSLCHAGKCPRRAQLPTSDEIDTPIGHGRLVIFHEEGSTVGQDWEGLPRSLPSSRRQLWVLAGFDPRSAQGPVEAPSV